MSVNSFNRLRNTNDLNLKGDIKDNINMYKVFEKHEKYLRRRGGNIRRGLNKDKNIHNHKDFDIHIHKMDKQTINYIRNRDGNNSLSNTSNSTLRNNVHINKDISIIRKNCEDIISKMNEAIEKYEKYIQSHDSNNSINNNGNSTIENDVKILNKIKK